MNKAEVKDIFRKIKEKVNIMMGLKRKKFNLQ